MTKNFTRKITTAALAAMIALGSSITAAPAHAEGKDILGLIGGAVGGGFIGSTIGKGSGRTVATATGAVLGGLAGQSVGRSLDRADRYERRAGYYDNSGYYGGGGYYETSRTYYAEPQPQRVYYVAPRSYEQRVRTYEVVPAPASYTVVDNSVGGYDQGYCREYNQRVTVGGRTQDSYGTACLQPDGSWKIQ